MENKEQTEYWNDRWRVYDRKMKELQEEIHLLNKYYDASHEMREWCSDMAKRCSRKTPSNN